MFQVIEGRTCFVVDIATFPPTLPITDGGDPELTPYANALTDAIVKKIVVEPGKYAIEVTGIGTRNVLWNVFRIEE